MAVITLLIGLKKDPTWIPKNMYIFFSVLPKAMQRKLKKNVESWGNQSSRGDNVFITFVKEGRQVRG